jgi:drug/metabolite transporter (DMT)-like permease
VASTSFVLQIAQWYSHIVKEPQSRDSVAILMVGTALFFDALQAMIGWIPIAGNFLAGLFSVAVFLTFLMWFWIYGVKMITPKRLGSMGLGGAIELIPYVNLLPAWTLVVVYLIGTTKIKELTQKHPTMAKGAVATGTKVRKMYKNPDFDVPLVDE